MNEEKTPSYTELIGEHVIEDKGYDVPFVTFTWKRWEEMHAQTYQRFARFQRAIEQGRPQVALLAALEMQQIIGEWLAEVCAQVKE